MNSRKKVLIGKTPFRLLFSRENILKKVNEFACRIVDNYKIIQTPPILLFVLTGGAYLGVDLSRALDELRFKHNIDTIRLKRYTDDEEGGPVRIVSLPGVSLGGRYVIVVEDLIDEGKTMNFLHSYLINLDYPPKKIEYCELYPKKWTRKCLLFLWVK